MSSAPSRRLRASSIAPRAKAWLAGTQQAYVLHSFERAINLVNQEGDVLTIADEGLGHGPFSLLIEDQLPQDIHIGSKLLVFENGLWLGDWLVDAEDAKLWQPTPDWTSIRSLSDLDWASQALAELLRQHATAESFAHLVVNPLGRSALPGRIQQAAEQRIPLLFAAVRDGDNGQAAQAAKGLAGLGPGLTPAGDDLLLGALFACWARLPSENARLLSQAIVSAAAPRTHQLSAAWLSAGAAGEAPAVWHELFEAIAKEDAVSLGEMAMRILPTGHSSGADALAGFSGVLQALHGGLA
ncbi:MAG: DUF2877 domain-containing protein [Anaerolineales bacterium]|nr:DUF2877 domain-containing protein [Anaerolineales bacterium]